MCLAQDTGLYLCCQFHAHTRILYSIKLGFLYRLNKQINERFIYEKVNVHIYYSLETDVPALQGAHTAACSVPMHHIAHQYTHMPMDSAQ